MSAIAMATMGKFEYVVDVGGGSGLDVGDGEKKKPQVTIGDVIEQEIDAEYYKTCDDKPQVVIKSISARSIKEERKFQIYKIEEEEI